MKNLNDLLLDQMKVAINFKEVRIIYSVSLLGQTISCRHQLPENVGESE